MKVIVNGKEKELKTDATLKDAVAGENHVEGSLVSVHMSTEKIVSETSDFELVTSIGTMILHLDDTDGAEAWKKAMSSAEGSTTRWVTKDIAAFGAFKTDIPSDKEERRYRKYDCFFSLGGADNHTTYMMIAKNEHKRVYSAGVGNIGRITFGRHVLDSIREGERLISVKPVVSEASSENFKVTKDLSMKLEEGYRVETNVLVRLNTDSPASSEHILIMGSKGYINVSEATGSFAGCRDDMDVEIPNESHGIREVGTVAVRNEGTGTGHILFYKERRTSSPYHNDAGMLERGSGIISRASAGDKITIVTDPERIISVGMTQKEASSFLASKGIKQKRGGDTSDDAIVVDQNPEMTLAVMNSKEAETIGVPRDKVFRISLSENVPADTYYFRKVTGLSHKPIGSMKTQFSFPGMSLITFYGDDERSKTLYPQEPFKKCNKGDIGLTNQSRPHHGLIGVRLENSKEYGPTGEEPYGTNIIGKFLDDLKKLAETEEDEIIYVTEAEL
jgi:putative methanogenesis marker protein 3